MKLISTLIFSITAIAAQAGEAEIRMSQKIIDINNGDLSCGKVVNAEKIQDTSKFLDVKAVCSNGEVYRMATVYGSARDVKVAIQCSKPFTGWGQEAANKLGITKTNCR
jgi:hypothetical protein